VRVSSRSQWWRRSGSDADEPSSAPAIVDADASERLTVDLPTVTAVSPPDADEQDLDQFVKWIQAEASAPTIAPESAHPETILTTEEYPNMSSLDDALQQLLAIEGATGAAIVDYASGMALAQGGNPSFDLGIAAAGNSNVVRAKLVTMRDLGVTDEIDDILITLTSQYHLINVLNTQNANGLFIYLVLTKSSANLALARHKLKAIAAQIEV
jgi:predicted regulator of Ras-like GTPase activity (Roadblock/LC7/MglB family)